MADLVRLTLRHPGGLTPIAVGAGALADASEELASWAAGRLVFFLSTPRVLALHGAAALSDPLAPVVAACARWVALTAEDGEAAKTPETAAGLWRRMLAAGGKRDSRLLAFGGGSLGDLGGFAAGCFLRGIEYAQLPTTLLAQVDAAVGGKTAVDLPEGKNSVGVFHHPARVVCDTALLTTLPREELRSGLVEVVKMAFLLDPALLALVERRLDALLAGEPQALAPVVAAAVRAKVTVVERDPAERDVRRLLNFGHTLGHAIEAVLQYGGLRHGEAVGWGMLFAVRLARRRGLDAVSAERLRTLLRRLELPPLPALPADALLAAIGRDKKASESGTAWVLPAGLGEGRVVEDVAPAEVAAELACFLAHPLAGE